MNNQPHIHPLIKAIALTVFILLPFIGLYLGMTYQRSITPINSQPAILTLTPSSPTKPADTTNNEPCVKAGCNGELCVTQSDSNRVVSACWVLPEFQCYRAATCERQANGACGLTETAEFNSCLNKYRAN